jgi:hypothetical protein
MHRVFHAPGPPRLLLLAVAAVSIALGGCVARTYVPGPGQSALNFERTKGHCQLVAQNSETGSWAFGSLGFVVGSQIGHAIDNAVRANNTFDACMRESGFVEAKPQVARANPTSNLTQTVGATQIGSATQTVGALQTPGVGLTMITELRLSAAKEQRRSCIEGVRADPRYQAILPHLPEIGTGKFSILQLADDTMPTRQEAQAFGAYVDEVRPCIEQMTRLVAAIFPSAEGVLVESINESDAVSLQFVKRELTWGQLASQQQQIESVAAVKISQVFSQ